MDTAAYRRVVADAVNDPQGELASPETIAAAEQALAMAQSLGDRSSEAVLRVSLGNSCRSIGDAAKSIEHLTAALGVIQAMSPGAGAWSLLNEIGMSHYLRNDMESAISCYERGLEIARRIDDREKEAISLFNIGDAYHVSDEVASAIPYYVKALVLNRRSCNYKCAAGLGLAYLQIGRRDEAMRYFQQCADICLADPDVWTGLQPRCASLGLSLLALGKVSESLEVYRRGLATSPSEEHLHYSILDLKLLSRASEPVEGVSEAIGLLEAAARGV